MYRENKLGPMFNDFELLECFAQYLSIHLLKPQSYQTQTVWVVIGLWNLKKFPFLNCVSGNKAWNFLGNFRETFESFLETVFVGTFLVFSRKFPKKWVCSMYPPAGYHKNFEVLVPRTGILFCGKLVIEKIMIGK